MARRPGIAMPAGIQAGLYATHFFNPASLTYASGANVAIVEAIVNLAQNLGMRTIAEWAEDIPTLDALAEMGRLKQEGGKHMFNFSGKVLSGGKLSHPVVIHADEFSKGAEKKITAAGGQAIAKKVPERVGEGAGKGKDAKRGKKAK